MNPQLTGFIIKSQEDDNSLTVPELEGYILHNPFKVVLSVAKRDMQGFSRSQRVTLDKSAVDELIRLLKNSLDTDKVVSAWNPKDNV